MLLVTGCFLRHPKAAHNPAPPPQQPQPPVSGPSAKPVIQPDLQLSGQVAMVNSGARFVVITFSGGTVPTIGQRLIIFRNGAKVGEVKVTGPQHENDTVADIISGDPQLHDEIRPE